MSSNKDSGPGGGAPSESAGPRGALALATCSAVSVSKDNPDKSMTDDPEYQKWVESMAVHCRCAHDRPCAGVLAGGLCDDIQDDGDGTSPW